MKKANILGIIVLSVIISTGIIIKFSLDSSQNTSNPQVAKNDQLNMAEFKPLIPPKVEEVVSKTTVIDGKSVPLITIPLDYWGGYALLLSANRGSKPNAESLFYQIGGFAVEFVSESNSTKQLEGYANGNYPIIWSSMDNVPILAEAFKVDKRASPRVFSILDWSTGGDGIIVRKKIKDSRDFKGKTIITSGNTPNNFFLLWFLAQNNITTTDLKMIFIPEAEAAIKTFRDNDSIDGIVTWEPFVSNILDSRSEFSTPDSRLFISSSDSMQLIADTLVTRADFAKGHEQLISDFVRALFTAYSEFKQNPSPVYGYLADFYKIRLDEAEGIMKRIKLVNFPETKMFFDEASSINAQKIFYLAQGYYKDAGSLPSDTNLTAESYLENSFLKEFETKKYFALQTNELLEKIIKQPNLNIDELEDKRIVLIQDAKIFFESQQISFDLKKDTIEMRENKRLLQHIADQASFLGATYIKLIGHLDTTRVQRFKDQGKKAYVEASVEAITLSKKRAEFIKHILVTDFGVPAERIFTEGRGWDSPISDIPDENRRVEIQFVSYE